MACALMKPLTEPACKEHSSAQEDPSLPPVWKSHSLAASGLRCAECCYALAQGQESVNGAVQLRIMGSAGEPGGMLGGGHGDLGAKARPGGGGGRQSVGGIPLVQSVPAISKEAFFFFCNVNTLQAPRSNPS